MSEPLKVLVTRYRCPHCPKTYAHKATTANHIGKCWYSADARGCKTCVHFTPYYRDDPDDCAEGVDLRGTEVIETEAGRSPVAAPQWVNPGPITGCAKWQAKTDPYEE
ncbi:hypothetical protein [Roseateles sp.]|uniref:hypothetical protein n=1 Tax=Roseateles sp. TaxID=1971397 RepID=UPI002F405D44